jgi:hypothetical protein
LQIFFEKTLNTERIADEESHLASMIELCAATHTGLDFYWDKPISLWRKCLGAWLRLQEQQ